MLHPGIPEKEVKIFVAINIGTHKIIKQYLVRG
jgi:hypothetical protein